MLSMLLKTSNDPLPTNDRGSKNKNGRKRKQIWQKKDYRSHAQLLELQNSIKILKEQCENIDQLLQQSSPYDKQRIGRMRKRKTRSIFEE